MALPLCLHAASPADKLVAYYARTDRSIDPLYLRYVAAETERLALATGHGDQVETMLSMWHVESHYQQFAGDGDSYGVAQTRKRYMQKLRTWWLTRGVSLGSQDDPTAQVAFGVAEFAQHWHFARHAGKGQLWETVMRYNGKGPPARIHADKVFKARLHIFGLPIPPRSKR